MNLYCNLEWAKAQGKFGKSTAASTDSDLEQLKRNMHIVSRRIDRELSPERDIPYFAPTTDTLKFPLTTSWLKEAGLIFSPGLPIQSVTTVTFKNRQISDTLTSYLEVNEEKKLEWTANTSSFWSYADYYGFGSKLEIAGVFGWSNSWSDSGDTVQDDPLSDSATTVTVSDVDASNPTYTGQRFEYGSIIRIESEIMHVVDADASGNTLTVTRGQNGTTAASHVQTTAIEVLDIPEPIQHITARQSGLLYSRVGAFQQVTTGLDGSTTSYPQDLLLELQAVLEEYRL